MASTTVKTPMWTAAACSPSAALPAFVATPASAPSTTVVTGTAATGLPTAAAFAGVMGVGVRARELGTPALRATAGNPSAYAHKTARIDDTQGFPPRGPAPA